MADFDIPQSIFDELASTSKELEATQEKLDEAVTKLENPVDKAREENILAITKLKSVLTSVERLRYANIGRAFMTGAKSVIADFMRENELRAKMFDFANANKLRYEPIVQSVQEEQRTDSKESSSFFKKLLLSAAAIGGVYLLFKDFIDQKLASIFERLSPAISAIGDSIKPVTDKIIEIADDISDGFRSFFDPNGEFITIIRSFFNDTLAKAITTSLGTLGEWLMKDETTIKDEQGNVLVTGWGAEKAREETKIAGFFDEEAENQRAVEYGKLADTMAKYYLSQNLSNADFKRITEDREALLALATDKLGFKYADTWASSSMNPFSDARYVTEEFVQVMRDRYWTLQKQQADANRRAQQDADVTRRVREANAKKQEMNDSVARKEINVNDVIEFKAYEKLSDLIERFVMGQGSYSFDTFSKNLADSIQRAFTAVADAIRVSTNVLLPDLAPTLAVESGDYTESEESTTINTTENRSDTKSYVISKDDRMTNIIQVSRIDVASFNESVSAMNNELKAQTANLIEQTKTISAIGSVVRQINSKEAPPAQNTSILLQPNGIFNLSAMTQNGGFASQTSNTKLGVNARMTLNTK